jgi:hypothetical protein
MPLPGPEEQRAELFSARRNKCICSSCFQRAENMMKKCTCPSNDRLTQPGRAAAADGHRDGSRNSHHRSHLHVGQVKHFGVTPFGLHASGQHNDPQMLPGRPASRRRGTPQARAGPGPGTGARHAPASSWPWKCSSCDAQSLEGSESEPDSEPHGMPLKT